MTMHSHPNFGYKFLLYVAGVFLFPVASMAIAQDSPVTCGTTVENGSIIISCDVRDDGVVLSDMSLNRGRCEIPRKLAEGVEDRILTFLTQDRPTTEEKLASTLMFISMMGTILELTNAQQLAAIANGSMDISEINDPKQPDLPLQIGVYLLATNVFKEYSFGEKVSISVSNCNLLEYSLTLNGIEYTWKN